MESKAKWSLQMLLVPFMLLNAVVLFLMTRELYSEDQLIAGADWNSKPLNSDIVFKPEEKQESVKLVETKPVESIISNIPEKFLQARPKIPYVAYAYEMLALGATKLDEANPPIAEADFPETDSTCKQKLTGNEFKLSRDLNENPITISGDRSGEMKECAVRCVFEAQGTDGSFNTDILRTMESAVYYPGTKVETAHANGIKVVMTPRLDSDVPVGYFSWAEYNFFDKAAVEKQNDTLASAVISNCGANSFRMEAIDKLEKQGVTIDKFGACFSNRFDGSKYDTIRKYKFHLSFENSIEIDYVTEKFLQALVTGTVPVVVGAPNIHDFAPAPNSILHIPRLEDTDKVAEQIKEISRNETLYNEMLRWKNEGPWDPFLALVDMAVVHSSCRLCIHQATKLYLKELETFQQDCRCQERGRASRKFYHKILVRERGKFNFRTVLLSSDSLASPAIFDFYNAIVSAFEEESYLPIWYGHRHDFRNTSNKLRLYKVYPVGVTQRAALYGSEAIDTERELVLLLRQPCPLLEVIFI